MKQPYQHFRNVVRYADDTPEIQVNKTWRFIANKTREVVIPLVFGEDRDALKALSDLAAVRLVEKFLAEPCTAFLCARLAHVMRKKQPACTKLYSPKQIARLHDLQVEYFRRVGFVPSVGGLIRRAYIYSRGKPPGLGLRIRWGFEPRPIMIPQLDAVEATLPFAQRIALSGLLTPVQAAELTGLDTLRVVRFTGSNRRWQWIKIGGTKYVTVESVLVWLGPIAAKQFHAFKKLEAWGVRVPYWFAWVPSRIRYQHTVTLDYRAPKDMHYTRLVDPRGRRF
jgi:hypothetical protein